MTHPLVDQLRFARSEFVRCLDGVSPEDAVRRVMPMNCLSWVVGHLASQENAYWVFVAQGKVIHPELRKLVGYGQPASTPPLAEMWTAWREITAEADCYLDTIEKEQLTVTLAVNGKALPETVGTMLYRNIYHYWYHLGEAAGIRQALGHTGLPDFVGDITFSAYRPE